MRLNRQKTVPGRRASAVGVLASLAACAGAVLGCGWEGFENSVRFNFRLSEREWQRLPPLPYRLGGKDGQRAQDSSDDDGYFDAVRLEDEADGLWERAEAAVRGGELSVAAGLLREFAERFADDARANSAADQLGALSALGTGSAPGGVRAYLEARRQFDLWSAGDTALGRSPEAAYAQKFGASKAVRPAAADGGAAAWAALSGLLREPPRDANLADNFAYLGAALLYHEEKFAEAAGAFRDLAARFPRSERREAALYMAARAELAQSAAYLGPGASATSEEACPDCRDAAWRAAREGFARAARQAASRQSGQASSETALAAGPRYAALCASSARAAMKSA
ncbi:MAG TPA: hypothetical protein VG148_12495, partial [Pyrinomonadaceae bacterium]|nr:hypothetical protein [Pyrinomonadaceae bacterium]